MHILEAFQKLARAFVKTMKYSQQTLYHTVFIDIYIKFETLRQGAEATRDPPGNAKCDGGNTFLSGEGSQQRRGGATQGLETGSSAPPGGYFYCSNGARSPLPARRMRGTPSATSTTVVASMPQ